MTAEQHDGRGPAPVDRTPKAIRACLPGDVVDTFDREYREAMARATVELDLASALQFVERWWAIAVLHAGGHYEQVMAAAERIQEAAARGDDLGTIPWDDDFDAALRRRMAAGQ